MAYPLEKDQYRPSVEETADRILEGDGIKAALTSYLLAMEGSTKYWEDARMTFTQMVSVLASRAEDGLIAEIFDQKEF